MEIATQFGRAVVFTKEMQKNNRLKNLKKTVYNVGMQVEEDLKGQDFVPWFFTLTYRNVDDWKPDHISKLMSRIKVYLLRRKIRFTYVWVAELQKRGAVHYHILIWLPKKFKLPKLGRCGWWPHGFTNQKIAKKSIGYLMKYCSKGVSKDDKFFPKGCRIYGFGGVSVLARRRVRFYRSSNLIQNSVVSSGFTYRDVDIRKCKGGRVDKLTGWFFPSEWGVYFLRGLPVFYKVNDGIPAYALLIDISEKIDYYISGVVV